MRIFKSFINSGLALPAIVVALWVYGSADGWWNRFLLPAPSAVLESILSMAESGELARHVTFSVLRIMGGFSLSVLAAIPLAALCGVNSSVRRQVWPLLEFMRHIPPLATVPLLILWLGIGEAPKLVIIVLASFFPIFLNTLQGISQCDAGLLDVARSFGYTKRQSVLRIIFPFALPYIITGMKLAIGYSWRSLIASELLAASSGLGYLILSAEQLSRTDIVMAGIFIIGVMGFIMDYSFSLLSKSLMPYMSKGAGKNALV